MVSGIRIFVQITLDAVYDTPVCVLHGITPPLKSVTFQQHRACYAKPDKTHD
jgi:hypothetical protein